MDVFLMEYGVHALVATDLALVVLVLEVVSFDVLPDFLDGLGPGELLGAEEGGKRLGELEWCL